MLRKLENKFTKFTIPNLTNYILAFIIIGFFINVFDADIYSKYLALDFAKISHGEVWRLFSYLLYDSNSFSILGILFFVFAIFFYSFIGRGLEMIWGRFWYNIYIFSGLLFNFLGSLIVYLITGETISQGFSPILQTLFLAFAFLFPDFKINLYMIIPIKLKWIGYLYAVLIAWGIISKFLIGGVLGIGLGVQEILSVLNLIVFIFITRDRQKDLNNLLKNITSNISRVVRNRQESNFDQQTIARNVEPKKMSDSVPKAQRAYHRCCVCGRTEVDNPELEFRYCSKCDGEHEYCSDHIKNHVHIKPKGET